MRKSLLITKLLCRVLPFIYIGVCTSLQASNSSDSLETTGYAQKIDIQLRLDDRSSRDLRSQYRLRFYPSLHLSDGWSLNGFIVTGDDFASSHNTLFDGSADYAYLRRFYLTKKSMWGKAEIGVIPTYKGRVSSTGLAKDGWIQGGRYVYNLPKNSAFEIVLGDLNQLNPNQALKFPNTLNYIEVEYSALVGSKHSYELSLEHMLQSDYARAEYRYQWLTESTLFIEWVQRLDIQRSKVVLGLSGQLNSKSQQSYEYFMYYSHVDVDFGQRAELTEDYLGSGHGISVELEGQLVKQVDWFLRVDVVGNTERLLSGIKFSW